MDVKISSKLVFKDISSSPYGLSSKTTHYAEHYSIFYNKKIIRNKGV
ncbi:hypothetical protein [Candidatus Tisiphia endosymbiont of Dioctria linearis]